MKDDTATLYDCVSDCYDANPGGPYTLPDFLDMCRACFGEAPELREDHLGNLHDDQEMVLVVRNESN